MERWIGTLILALALGTVNAQEPRDAAPPPGVPPRADAEQEAIKVVEKLSALIKDRLVQALPSKLVFEKANNWGHQAQIPSLQGLTPIYVMRNHGDWQKSKVITGKMPLHLKVNVGELYATAENRVSFTVHLTVPAELELRQQIWQNGVQVFTSHLCSRFRLAAQLHMEADLQPNTDGAAPRNSVRLKLVSGNYSCGHFVAQNVNGLGGDFAHLLDNGAGRSFKPWQPAILNDFQNTVSPLVAAAGEAPEMQPYLSKLLLHANDRRLSYLQSHLTAGVPAINGPAALPPSIPLFLNASFDFVDISNVSRVRVPHFDRLLLHPGMTDFAVHVAHAALIAETHTHTKK